MKKLVRFTGLLLACSMFNSFADQPELSGTIEFDRSRLFDCYNSGEIVFFRDGRMTYNGDDFTIIEPEHWLLPGGLVEPGAKVGVRFTRVDIEQAPMSIHSFDKNGSQLRFNQSDMPKEGSEVLLTVSSTPIAFSLEFDHDTAGMDVTFELFDPLNADNAAAMDFGLNCT